MPHLLLTYLILHLIWKLKNDVIGAYIWSCKYGLLRLLIRSNWHSVSLVSILFLGPVPKEGNVLKVMEYIATMVDFEECVAEALEYLVELSKQDDNFNLDINGKRMIKAAMRNNLPIKEIQIAGCNLFNCLIISGR